MNIHKSIYATSTNNMTWQKYSGCRDDGPTGSKVTSAKQIMKQSFLIMMKLIKNFGKIMNTLPDDKPTFITSTAVSCRYQSASIKV